MNVWERISDSGRSLIEQGHLVDEEEALAFPASTEVGSMTSSSGRQATLATPTVR
jgi:hypothetical protein